MFKSGEVIGSYTLVRKLGEGYFGVVWLAEDNSDTSHGEVALKTLKQPDANAILQEVFNWAKADGHPNILPILEAGVYPTSHGDVPIIVSSYIGQGSLRSWIEKNQLVSVETVIELSCGILDGLEHLHRRNIIHRDLKPENVLIYQNVPLLTDFGIARVQRSEADIQSFSVAGTIPYMAPEAFQGVRSPQTDVWAAAVICYELLAGRRPFAAAMRQITGAAQAPPLPNSVPRDLRKILDFALRKDQALRCYKSAAELRAALLDALHKIRTDVRSPVETTDDSTIPMLPAEGYANEEREPASSRPSLRGTNFQRVMDIDVDKLRSDTIEITHRKGKRQRASDEPESSSLTKFKAGEIKAKKFTLTGEEEG